MQKKGKQMLSKDPYDILGVSPYATDDEVKRAYRDLAKKYHPDLHVDNPLAELAQDKFREVQEAYDAVMQERASGMPHSYQSENGQSGTYNNGRAADPFGFGGGYSNQGYQNNYNNYQQRQNQYRGESGNDPCNCCMELWCLDSICECMGGDLIRCC